MQTETSCEIIKCKKCTDSNEELKKEFEEKFGKECCLCNLDNKGIIIHSCDEDGNQKRNK